MQRAKSSREFYRPGCPPKVYRFHRVEKDGETLCRSRCGAQQGDVTKFLEGLEGPKHVVLEACSIWEHVYDEATKLTQDVTLAQPYKVRLIAEACLKSDKVRPGTSSSALDSTTTTSNPSNAWAGEPLARTMGT